MLEQRYMQLGCAASHDMPRLGMTYDEKRNLINSHLKQSQFDMAFDAFNEKVFGLVLRFVSSSNSAISYFILKYSYGAIGMCPSVNYEILDATLQSLLLQSKSTKISGLARCVKIMNFDKNIPVYSFSCFQFFFFIFINFLAKKC